MLLKIETEVIAFKKLYQKIRGATTASPRQSYKTRHWKGLSCLPQNSIGPENAMEKDITASCPRQNAYAQPKIN